MSTFKADPNNPLPLYYQVFNSLRERIELEEFTAGTALPPERQLCEEYDVSRITIVKALDTLVRDGLIEKQQGRGTFVLEQSTTEASNEMAIGYMPASLLHPYFYSIQVGIAETITQEKCELHVIGMTDKQRKDIDSLLNTITDSVDGMIVYPRQNKQDLELYRRLHKQQIPFVMVDRYYDEIEADSVIFADKQASYDLTKMLIERGHRRIAIISHYEVNVSSIRNRIRGYTRSLEDHDIAVEDHLIWLDVYSNLRPAIGQKGDESMTDNLNMLIKEHAPTALIAINQDVNQRLTYDLMTINHQRAQTVIRNNGNHDYELQIEVAAFGTNHPEDDGPYNIATALQPGDVLGKRAAQILIERLTGKLDSSPQRLQIPIDIVFRHDKPSADREVLLSE